MTASYPSTLCPEDGYRLWLRYDKIADRAVLEAYRRQITQIVIEGDSPTLRAARIELERALPVLLGVQVPGAPAPTRAGALVVGTPADSSILREPGLADRLPEGPDEGYLLSACSVAGWPGIAIVSRSDHGVLYGVFHLLRLLSTERTLSGLAVTSSPRVKLRLLNHWDNLDGTIERGYAGFSLWDWHKLPGYVSPRIIDYARANASIGINGAVLTNVNAHPLVLTPVYIEKVRALADVLRPYGVRVYLTAPFSAPMEVGGLYTADPLDRGVVAWWKAKADEIYRSIPDFGGFLIKANSEGQPGPQDYGRSHADGANLLAHALEPHGGVVIWRAFVYSRTVSEDRVRQAYDEFVPLDGKFRSNVLVQVKNGPLDFQPREPFHPLFGAMPKTPLMLELQLAQEYLGCATHLVYLAPLMRETLSSDTWARGEGSTVARVVDGSLDGHALTGIAAVANTGTDRNWCGHPFAAANWYAFGRLAWDPAESSESIAEDWIRMTLTRNTEAAVRIASMMIASREAVVDYMTPLGLHHIMARDHHYGPGPWVDQGPAEWTSVYYHRADAVGIGFDRTSGGSRALEQYHASVSKKFENLEQCDSKFLLWFHHVPWDHHLASGRTLWEELCHRYQAGVDAVRRMHESWNDCAPEIDRAVWEHVKSLLAIQEQEARWWRDACLLYFQTFSGRSLPEGVQRPERSLEEYRQRIDYYVPGILERRFQAERRFLQPTASSWSQQESDRGPAQAPK